ncbi:hypothetical protein [Labrys neptuniae]
MSNADPRYAGEVVGAGAVLRLHGHALDQGAEEARESGNVGFRLKPDPRLLGAEPGMIFRARDNKATVNPGSQYQAPCANK